MSIQVVVQYPKLPERVAIHFDGSGKGDSFASKQTLVAMNVGITLGLFLLFTLTTLLIVGTLSSSNKDCQRCVNMPNKDYWLATPENRFRAMEVLGSMNLFLGAASTLFMLALSSLVYQANISNSVAPTLSWAFWLLLGAYLAGNIAIIVWAVVIMKPEDSMQQRYRVLAQQSQSLTY